MTRLLLVHIAKTGGTSLRRLLKSTPAISSFDCLHNGNLLCFEGGRRIARQPLDPHSLTSYDVAVLMVRHPLDRLASCHRYFLHGGLNQRGQGPFPGDVATQRFLQEQAPTLAACCQRLPQVAERIPHFQPACHWLDPLPNPLADLVFTGRQERFSQDVQRLFQLLGLAGEAVEPEHVNRSPATADAGLDPLSIRLAERFYAADYQRFGYRHSPLPSPQLIQYWDQPDPPPPLLERMEQWRQQNPGWCYRRHDRRSAAAFIGAAYGSALKEAFLDIRLPAMQADVFRIAVLQAEGGVWIDAATRCHQPLEAWLDRQQPLLMLRRVHQGEGKVSTGVMAASDQGHPLLVAAWQHIAAALLARRGRKVYRDFGPGLLRDLLAEGEPLLRAGLLVVPEADLLERLAIGSSSEVLGEKRHWSQRQQRESLYLSGGRPSASQRSNEAS